MKIIVLLISGLLGTVLLFGQDDPVSTGSAKEDLQGGGAAKAGEGSSKNERAALEYLFNEQPKEGTAAEKAAMLSEILGTKATALDALNGVGNSIPAGFEAYLSSEESDAARIADYERSYDEAVNLVRRRQVAPAMEILINLSTYTWDAGTSEQLVNRVLAVWDMRRNQKDLIALNVQLQKKARDSAHNFDIESDTVLKKMSETDRINRMRAKDATTGRKRSSEDDKTNSEFIPAPSPQAVPSMTPAVDTVLGKMKLTEEYLQGLEARAGIKLNEAQMKQAEAKARADFAAFIKLLHDGQWHHQTKLAADCYRVLFGDGDLPVDVARMASISGEILQKVRGNSPVIDFMTKQGKYVSATKILQEDFTQAPNHPVLRGITRTEKLRVADYLTKLRQIQNLIEARDFGSLDKLLPQLERDVKDFDPTKPRSLVRAVKRESQMRLGMAKLAAQQGDQTKALAEFKSASEAWPDNPDLETASETFFRTQDVLNKSTIEFDRAVREANYRHVFDNSLEYGAAVKGDELREQQMRTALEKVKEAETALEKARLFEKNGDSFGSWEVLELAAKLWPEDSKLNQRRAELSIQASEFVSKISKATKAESKGQTSVALAYYLSARTEYPPSTMANESIIRLSDRLLERPGALSAKGASATEQ